jgi:hypothetical protein
MKVENEKKGVGIFGILYIIVCTILFVLTLGIFGSDE